jgi:L-fuculose-phosphate aldolase
MRPPVSATAVSTIVDTLPAIHYQLADLGGPVPVAAYRTFGTPELAEVVSKAMQDRGAALMQNHGAVTTGESVDQAFARSVTLEWLCRVFLVAKQSGSPSLIDDRELERVKAQQSWFRGEQRRRLRKRQSGD